jgi:Tol biopolymer transport system component
MCVPIPFNQWLAAFLAALILASGSHIPAFAEVPVGMFKPAIRTTIQSFRNADPSVTADDSSMFFESDRPNGQGGFDIWVSRRVSLEDPFQAPINASELNSSSNDGGPDISSDGTSVVFASDRPGGEGNFDIWSASRTAAANTFGQPTLVAELNTRYIENDPSITDDGLLIFWESDRLGGQGDVDIWMASRSDLSQPFTVVRNLEELNSPFEDDDPEISSDGLTLFFSTTRGSNDGVETIWVAHRDTRNSAFGEPVSINEFSGGATIDQESTAEFTPGLSPDWPAAGSFLYYGSAASEATWALQAAEWVPEPTGFSLLTIALAVVAFPSVSVLRVPRAGGDVSSRGAARARRLRR